ncbi:RICIN domain-containing protein [Streptomyces mobaraensis NBRC 13819 = DSM 40847]|uniref:RICIN domain-containing protein n=1 Tax=Streptomyces mobaraensis TaxID=35621 RepID=A0A5N5VZC0_STRMB|nr:MULTISPECIES: RICIN domain-containing protein [Streptomyces]KAB7834252.1 RICIN domain-containing protein [Streptomyces mobaraensis]MBC2879087.1 RICIN domain-containing protein [Streptomyces sp. TYQ1024]QTT76421.1 RICIN domain-containing protein [Streptomyces mobaraensis NBRC 13819 = DSM 40847]UBI36060.1 RICIN domain-containing protein [Streptomyces mobaraensis]UKW28654.1 RICIN domain-containing protein [Streptomyces sp. TYQ1024]
MRRALVAGTLALGLAAAVPVLAATPASALDAFEIRNDRSGKCLTVNGDNVEIRTCGNGSSQWWMWDGKKLRSLANMHCLDVRNGGINEAVQAVGDCHGNANQRWFFWNRELHTDLNGQIAQVQRADDTWDGAGINMHDPNGGSWQHWYTTQV